MQIFFLGWDVTCLWFYDRLCVSLSISLHAAAIGMLDQVIVFRFESALQERLHLIIYNALVGINYEVSKWGSSIWDISVRFVRQSGKARVVFLPEFP